jgi:hypothetical protein
MARFARQALATYAFFEDASRSQKSPEDALIPFVLPAIAGHAGEFYSPADVAKQLEPIFGSELVLPFAESLTEPLARNGYLEYSAGGPEGAIYIYTDKTAEIPVEASASRADHDLKLVIGALREYLDATTTLKPVRISETELRDGFVDWITTSDVPSAPDSSSPSEPSPTAVPAGRPTGDLQFEILFSSFVRWACRERPLVFEKIQTFAELGLVIDLVSEIRVPTRRVKTVDLSVVLDSPVLMELLGLKGPLLQASARRLLELCKQFHVNVMTLTHLVQEMADVCAYVLDHSVHGGPGSIQEAIRTYPSVIEMVRKVCRSPDAQIKAFGIKIAQWTQVADKRSEALFGQDDIDRFVGELGYGGADIVARRDAWSLAYAVRRQNETYSSALYEAKCVVVTRNQRMVIAARRFLREKKGVYPNYAALPVIELRHFSTQFLLFFGTGAANKVVRAELIASCDRIVRASPGLINKVRTVLQRVSAFSDQELESILSDPATVAEFTLATGNDPSVVTTQNANALVEIIKNTAVKDEQLRAQERERQKQLEFESQLQAKDQQLSLVQEQVTAQEETVLQLQRDRDAIRGDLERQRQQSILLTCSDIRSEFSLYSRLIAVSAVIFGIALVFDQFKDLTKISTTLRLVIGIPVAAFVLYAALALFWPSIDPASIRRRALRSVAQRRLRAFADETFRASVWQELGFSRDGGESSGGRQTSGG